ncbi:MAG: ABC transporter substrate-binding protein [Acidimicrobiaceae bacterium]|nr:ABC transporter substrate-binding protein [Acidimicrobiaceae bacterium]MCY4280363.1 ABC transporter substrate-binding protein [Acidimicrobiaceae bacterium]
MVAALAMVAASCSSNGGSGGDSTVADLQTRAFEAFAQGDRSELNQAAGNSVTPAMAPTTGITDQRILFGQSAALSGPASELGVNMRLGIEAAFKEANRAGGVHGRMLELQTLDDAYEPEDAIVKTRHLIETEQVFALIGAVGTPTSLAATPIARAAGVPYIAPFTGAAFLRDSEWDNIINLRASYGQETEEMVARLTDDLGVTRIGVVFQNDSFGRAGFRGVTAALDRRGMTPASIGLYPRNTTAVKTALIDVNQGDPEAVIIIGAYEPVARLIQWARLIDSDPIFMTVSFVGSNALAQELGPEGAGVLVTQVVPFPEDDSLPVVQSYQTALRRHDPLADPGFVSLEGYMAGRMVIEALQQCGADLDRSCLLEELVEIGSIDIDGFNLEFGENDNQGSDEVYLTVIGSDGAYHPVDTLLETSRWVTQ